jgi:hypothetical protein
LRFVRRRQDTVCVHPRAAGEWQAQDVDFFDVFDGFDVFARYRARSALQRLLYSLVVVYQLRQRR